MASAIELYLLATQGLGSQSDVSPVTVTAAVATRVTKSWTIPATAAAGSVWRITAWGAGTQGSSAQTLSMWLFAQGNQEAGAGYANTFAGTSTAFGWRATGWYQVTSPGASGTAQYTWDVQVRAAGASSSTSLLGWTNGVTVNTTASGSIYLMAGWGATTGAPTITCDGSMLESLGAAAL